MPFPRPTTGRLTTPTPDTDPYTTVYCEATTYSCPTLAAVDAHLTSLTARIAQAHALPKLQAQYRRDADALLERRVWLVQQAQKLNSGLE